MGMEVIDWWEGAGAGEWGVLRVGEGDPRR